MSNFDLDKSKWFNATGIERASSWIKDDAKSVSAYAGNLMKFEHDTKVAASIDRAELALTEALLAVRVVQEQYKNKLQPVLQAAE